MSVWHWRLLRNLAARTEPVWHAFLLLAAMLPQLVLVLYSQRLAAARRCSLLMRGCGWCGVVATVLVVCRKQCSTNVLYTYGACAAQRLMLAPNLSASSGRSDAE